MPELHPYMLLVSAFVLGFVPIAVGACTSYLKISIVLGMLRNALGTQHAPGALIVMVLSVALSMYVMQPVIDQTLSAAQSLPLQTVFEKPSLDGLRKLEPLAAPWRGFMEKHAGKREVRTFASLDGAPAASAENSWRVLLPAFVVSELKQAFAMGFVLLLPFLVIDLIVANILVGMGMQMVSPVMIALPLKLLLFVLSDGWLLLSRGLILSYRA